MTEVPVICDADLDDPAHQRGILEILNLYASEPITGGEPLSADVQANLIPRLREQENGRYFVALLDARVIGVAICFAGFSTFRAKPLVNLHDLAVHPDHRGRGIGRRLLRAVEDDATARGCCAITLEVSEANPARRLYERYGFEGGNPDAETSLFMAKRLTSR